MKEIKFDNEVVQILESWNREYDKKQIEIEEVANEILKMLL